MPVVIYSNVDKDNEEEEVDYKDTEGNDKS